MCWAVCLSFLRRENKACSYLKDAEPRKSSSLTSYIFQLFEYETASYATINDRIREAFAYSKHSHM